MNKFKRKQMRTIALMCCVLAVNLSACRGAQSNTESEVPEVVIHTQNLPASTELDVSDFSEGDLDRMFYSRVIDEEIFRRIDGKSYRENHMVTIDELRYLRMLYKDINGKTHIGEMIVNQSIAADVLAIFRELYRQSYPIEQMVLVDDYDANDERSMSANNTSAFNYRTIENTDILSNHSKGLAVDINPLYNPYIYRTASGVEICSPALGKKYADRSKSFDYKIDENDLAYRLFTEHGFTWGGNWEDSKDYQHFEKAN